jgi:uncharacterized membrane protein YeaQ/YmgE (transglycosylase-associated protein family)
MNIWDFLILLIIAGVSGCIAQVLAGFSRGGCLISIAVGFIGALIGMWLQRLTGLPEVLLVDVGETQFPVVWSIIGGVIFVIVLSFLTRPRRSAV